MNVQLCNSKISPSYFTATRWVPTMQLSAMHRTCFTCYKHNCDSKTDKVGHKLFHLFRHSSDINLTPGTWFFERSAYPGSYIPHTNWFFVWSYRCLSRHTRAVEMYDRYLYLHTSYSICIHLMATEILSRTRRMSSQNVLYSFNSLLSLIVMLFIFSKLLPSLLLYSFISIQPWRPDLPGTRAQSCDRYGSGTLHPGQVLGGSLPLFSPAFRRSHFPSATTREILAAKGGIVGEKDFR